MDKSPDAFRTISEVAEWLDVPTHVLRFWESRFSQIKPVKRAGGRRYYRPSDMRLIGGVKVLLHDQGMTIRAVQKLLREEGIKHVSEYSQPLDSEGEDDDVIESTAVEVADPAPVTPAPAARGTREATPAPVEDEAVENVGDLSDEASEETAPDAPEPDEAPADAPVMFRRSQPRPVPTPEPVVEAAPEPDPEPEAPAPTIPDTPDVPATDPLDDDPGFAKDTGLAARIATAPASRIAAHRAQLGPLRDRLVELRDRLS